MPARKTAPKTPPARPLRIAYIGNFVAPHSTENHVANALEYNGCYVERAQENDLNTWGRLRDLLHSPEAPDLILWTRTGWNWTELGLTDAAARLMQTTLLLDASRRGVPVVGYHLDLWIGLARERQLFEEPFFKADLVVTADGGHDHHWESVGINHLWMPPGVSRAEAQVGTYREDLASPLTFVGSWDGGYHPEHQHRHELIRWLKANHRSRCSFWPQPGRPAVRGQALQDLYASVDVVIGDSCFAGSGLASYWSDRVPEVIGRGGFLVHPRVPGMDAHFTTAQAGTPGSMADAHFMEWDAGDWDQLGESIEWALGNPDERRAIALRGREHVLAHHTYEVRMEQLMTELRARGMLK